MSAPLRVVAFGGGHGLAATLRALSDLPAEITAVVTVADDGGSSGRLREELSALPPGDLRMALAALTPEEDPAATWGRLVQHRFAGGGSLHGHPVGNLMLVALTDLLGDPVEALDTMAGLLQARGRVLPLAVEPLDIVAEVSGLIPDDPGALTTVRGQVAVATTPGRVVHVRVEPEHPQVCKEALAAVADADWLVFGPGSWFTSVLAHLLVPEVATAVGSAPGRRLVTLNLAPQPGETTGFSPAAHLEALVAHVPDIAVDVVLADRRSLRDGVSRADLAGAVEGIGGRLVVDDVAAADDAARHDPQRLARAYRRILGVGGAEGEHGWR